MHIIEATIPAVGTANAAYDQVIDEAPFDAIVKGVEIIPEAALVAHATNFRTLRVVNKGQAGSGSAVVASFATDTPTTDDLVAFDKKVIPLSGTADNLKLVKGDVIAADETVAAAGVAHSGYRIRVLLERR